MTLATRTTTTCPECDGKTSKVKPITIESLVVDEARVALADTRGFRFCPSTGCDTAYFRPGTNVRVSKDQVKVRIGQKETTSPRPVCYCFSHTIEGIEAEVAKTGTSELADAITAKCRQGLDRCEETNPQGRCCLGDVRAAVKAAQTVVPTAPAEAASGQAGSATADDTHDCCSAGDVMDSSQEDAEGKSRPRGELLATGGAVFSAILSSVCCWLPLLLVGFGLSAGSVASAFEAYRPVLLGVTGLFLAGGFYLTYFRKENCAANNACAVPNRKLALFNKVSLWVATLVVAVFAFFPNYVGAFLSDGGDLSPPPTSVAPSEASQVGDPASQKTVWVRIEGMTCEACTVGITAELKKVMGASNVHVDFDKKLASLTISANVDSSAILRAVKKAGYKGRIHNRSK